MDHLAYILENQKEVFAFLKAHFPLYHQSNVFLRDLQYGIRTMLGQKGMNVSYPVAEAIARGFAEHLEKEKIFTRIDQQTWVVNYPEYRKPVVKPAPRPAAGAPAVPRPVPSRTAAGSAPAAVKPAAAVPQAPPGAGGEPAA